MAKKPWCRNNTGDMWQTRCVKDIASTLLALTCCLCEYRPGNAQQRRRIRRQEFTGTHGASALSRSLSLRRSPKTTNPQTTRYGLTPPRGRPTERQHQTIAQNMIEITRRQCQLSSLESPCEIPASTIQPQLGTKSLHRQERDSNRSSSTELRKPRS